MYRVTSIWTGFPGAPGYTNLYFGEPIAGTIPLQGAVDRVRDFFSAMALCFPSGTRIQVQPNVAGINAETGAQEDEYQAGTTPAVVAGAGSDNYSGVSGACVTWRTADFVGGRRVRGRTFLVPLAANAYQDDGTVQPLRLAEIRTAAQALAVDTLFEGAALVVWHRPTNQAGGSEHGTIGATVADQAAILRSRR